MSGRLPLRVPLPEVPHYTENIIFGALDLPVGFDQERLLVNLRAFDRVQRAAGLGTTSVMAGRGEVAPVLPDITGIDDTGIATMGIATQGTNRPLSSATVRFPLPSAKQWGMPDTIIRVDNGELENRLEESDRYKRGAFDVNGRAKFMDRALRRGLLSASLQANLDKDKLITTVSTQIPIGFLFDIALPPETALPAAGLALNMLMSITAALYLEQDKEERLKIFRGYRHSVFFGITPDRFMVSGGLLAARKLIKAQK